MWLLCSHGDVLKSILADALGQHLDTFQRIVVNPASVSVVQYTETRPFVLRMNDNGGELASIVPRQAAAGANRTVLVRVTRCRAARRAARPDLELLLHATRENPSRSG